jgi:hypothetical protein
MTDLAGSHLAKFCDSFVLKEPFQIHEIIFIASDKASFISGASIPVNGGKAAL